MRNKRRSVHMTASVAFVAMYALTTLAANADVGVTVNGSAVNIDPAPIVQAGRVFVPLRGVFEQLGASVVYSNGTINATGNGRDITLQIGSTQATVNGQSQLIDVAPFIVGASTYVPLRFISEALGDSVSWDDADSIAAIDTGGGSSDYYAPGTPSYVDTAPPPIPVYDQPYVPQPNYIWQPGYWAWGQYGYYWVPGTWVEAPQTGYLWTPGYWQGNDSGFHWNPGFWASSVGYYGGVNYGNGYYGNGYDGGRWSGNQFNYNTYVTHVNTTVVRNVYIDRTVYIDNAATRVGYNGGKYGLKARPTVQQLDVAKQRHVGMTAVQMQHVKAAEGDRRLLASVNHNKPPVLAVAQPLSNVNRSAALVPVKASDRVNPLANVAPVRVHAVRAVRPAQHVAAVHSVATAPHATAVHRAAPVVRKETPVVHEAVPVVHRAVPVVHEAAPVVHEAVPVLHRTVPVAHEAAPIVHVAPVVHVAAPVYHAPAPAVAAAPAYREHVIHETAPVARAPIAHEAAPVYRAPAVYAAPHRAAAPAPAPARVAAPVRAPAPAREAAPARPAPAAHEPAHEPPHS